jgi:hypothetical protein
VIRDILASNHFGVGEGELRHIMGSLMRQADVVDGQVVDFRRFLTAVRPRVWYEISLSRYVLARRGSGRHSSPLMRPRNLPYSCAWMDPVHVYIEVHAWGYEPDHQLLMEVRP